MATFEQIFGKDAERYKSNGMIALTTRTGAGAEDAIDVPADDEGLEIIVSNAIAMVLQLGELVIGSPTSDTTVVIQYFDAETVNEKVLANEDTEEDFQRIEEVLKLNHSVYGVAAPSGFHSLWDQIRKEDTDGA